MTTPEPMPYRTTWIERLAPLGGIIFAAWVLVGFFTSEDYGDTPQSVVEFAESSETNTYIMAILGLAAPLLLGWFLGGLMAVMRPASTALRTITLVGGVLLIVFVTVGITIWSAPLLDDNFDVSTAAVYLALDDFGWVIIGTGGVGAAIMIIAVSIAALRHGWVPAWLGWLSLALGVVAFSSVAAIGLFAWLAWLIGAGALLLWRGVPGSEPAVR